MGMDKEKSEEQVLRSEGGDDVERRGWVEGDEREGKKCKKCTSNAGLHERDLGYILERMSLRGVHY